MHRIIGWRRIEGEDCYITMRRMNRGMDRAMTLHFVQAWSVRLLEFQYQYVLHISEAPFRSWTNRII